MSKENDEVFKKYNDVVKIPSSDFRSVVAVIVLENGLTSRVIGSNLKEILRKISHRADVENITGITFLKEEDYKETRYTRWY